ncbi:MAG: hypothetical protein KUG77_01805, partial [Nannocystaceae bacterium]|nr:hypothetical protein [Nannocystaceae bacterium]
MLAGVAFLVIAAVAVAAYFVLNAEDGPAQAPQTEVRAQEVGSTTAEPEAASPSPPKPVEPDAATAEAKKKRVAPSFDEISWTTPAPATLQDLSRTWSVPRDVLAKLN